MTLMHSFGELYSEDFKVFFEMFVFQKLRSINLFFDVASFISKCQVGLSSENIKKMGPIKVIIIIFLI
jgi:hypothetical protein